MIYSKFYDYYDIFHSKEFHWKRKTKIIAFKDIRDMAIRQYIINLNNDMPTVKFRFSNLQFYSGESIIFGICGKLKLFYLLYDKKNKYKLYTDVSKYINQILKTKESRKERRWIKKYKKNYINRKINEYNNWIQKYENNDKNLDIFLYFKTPIFIIHNEPVWEIKKQIYYEIIINPFLKKYNLQKIEDYNPQQMYQKIEQFLTNELAQSLDKPDNISDKLKRDAHGFDKWSFKKHKHQRKGKK